ncbi:hypothetical protein ACVGWN_12800, partial [Enterobacter hormaechei]
VMMTAVSFIIGVLGRFVGARGGGPRRPLNRPNLFTRLLGATQVGIFFKTPLFFILKTHPDFGHILLKKKKNPTKKKKKKIINTNN